MKYATPGFYVLALVCFLLPWASVTCTVPNFESSMPDAKEMKISQTGLQMITGKSSVSIDGKAPTEEERKEMEEDDSPMNLNELNTAPLLIVFPLALLIGLAMSFSLPRIAGIAGGVAVAIGIAQFAIGFPITEKIKEMQREAGEMDGMTNSGEAAHMFDMDMDKGYPGFMDELEDKALDNNDPGPNAKEDVSDPEGCNQDETQGTDEEPTFPIFEEGDSGTVEMIPGETMEAMPGDMENSFEMDFNDDMEQGMAGMIASGFERHTEPYFWLSMVCALLGTITGLMQGLGLKVSFASTEPDPPAPAPDPSSAGAVIPAEKAGNIGDPSQDGETGGE
jgi:hypothetical protein